MRIGDLPLMMTTWLSRLDRLVCTDNCNTNPYLATFVVYLLMLMASFRVSSAVAEIYNSLDDVYEFMLPRAEGLGCMCLILCLAESIMLCGSVPDIIARFLIVLLLACIFYLAGLFLPWVGYIVLGAAALAYIIRMVELIVGAARKERTPDVR